MPEPSVNPTLADNPDTEGTIPNSRDSLTKWGKAGPSFQPAMFPSQQQCWYPGYNNPYQHANMGGRPPVQNMSFLKGFSFHVQAGINPTHGT